MVRFFLMLLAARADDLPFRHSRERGNPGPLMREPLKSLEFPRSRERRSKARGPDDSNPIADAMPVT
jgi:hypothetical protein